MATRRINAVIHHLRRVVLQYSDGKPQLWLELIVSEAEAERLPLPLRGVGGAAGITRPPRR